MWTYRAGQGKAVKMQKDAPGSERASEGWGQSAGAGVAVKGPPHVIRHDFGDLSAAAKQRTLFGTVYLTGLLAGSLASAFLGADAAAYAGLYRDALLELFCTAAPTRLFSSQFLAAFLQLSLTALCGLCALGAPLLLLLLLVRGAAFGCFCAAVLAVYRTQGALFLALIFWLPEVLGTVLQILLSVLAMRSAIQIGLLCFGKDSPRRSETPRRLLNAYLTLCLCALVPCGLSAVLALLFGPLIGG